METKLDYKLIGNIVFDGIDYEDYPDFCDAYIVSADYDGVPMTEDELELLNQDSSFVHERVWDYIF